MIPQSRSREKLSKRRSSVACIFSISFLHPPSSTKGTSVHNLGQTRSSHQRNHLLLTPDTFVRTTLPGMQRAAAIVHIAPALGAAFTQYTAEFESSGELGGTAAQRFVYVMEGTLTLDADGKSTRLAAGDYCYVPQGLPHRIAAAQVGRATVVEKSYQSIAKIP